MYNVVFESNARIWINTYIEWYTWYYVDLYSDSGIWSEDQIIDGYKKEWYARYDEIVDIIVQTLENDIVSYMKNETLIRWRTKVIIARFRDEWDTRIRNTIDP